MNVMLICRQTQLFDPMNCANCGTPFPLDRYWIFVYPISVIAPETEQAAKQLLATGWRKDWLESHPDNQLAFAVEDREGWICKTCFETLVNQVKQALEGT